MTTPGNDGPRLSDEDRDRIVQRLQHAFAEGRLSPEELDERLERALTAISGGDLMPVTAGLPDPVVEDVVQLRSTGGRIKRTGEWRVPRRLRVESEYGGVVLDLSQAVVDHPRIEIDLRLAYGSATIVLPPGATADVDGVATEWGGVTCKVPARAHPGRPHVQVTGELAYGSVRVRYPRPWS
ncbi:DUF1707 domain-containing protein [Streptosporangium longisporum]|uniref:DUF1707 domain-containing protein n=1 Tax=Streptosporangium longisporum TaxID=46187 RepID=A0ABP6KGY5_9ACTN